MTAMVAPIVYRSRIIYPPQLARPKVADDAKMQNITSVVPLGSALSLSLSLV